MFDELSIFKTQMQEAIFDISKLDKQFVKSINQLKKMPPSFDHVIKCTATMLNQPHDIQSLILSNVKKFVMSIQSLNLHKIDASILEEVTKYIDHPLMDAGQIKNDSKQIYSLYNWCVSAFHYARTF